ncbi:MAG: hypothetical protein OSB05_10610 [Akkermansiaceae bacterium]|nr:hypothetical protein [Akkermansiaceae bacterium]
MTYKTKRFLWARWQRLKRWEFWPVWAVYPPVLASVVWHGIRLRGLTLWTNCNPAMEASGMALEAKGGILDSFSGPAGRVRLARYLRIEAGAEDAFQQVKGFMKERGLEYPVVFKPDFGQRGQGVEIVKNEKAAKCWMENCQEGFLVQELITGLEFGVHWSKYPDEEKGMIASLCGKHPQFVRGDGERTLERLILDDDRAVLMARYYFCKFVGSLGKVLERNERFTLAPIGTHARGAVFTDERSLITDELREVFDELGARFPGFNHGRYDVKVPSVENLQAGRNIVVLELNGVMGEHAHIYQPGYPWWKGVRDLCGQFRRAAEVGAAWRAKGVQPPEPGDLLDLIRRHCEKDYLEVDEFERNH